MNDKMDKNASLMTDLYMMLCVLLIAALSMGMMLTGHDFAVINTIYLGVTLLVVLMAYFLGLVAGMGGAMVFMFCQALYMIYRYTTGGDVPLAMIFWLVLPPAIMLSLYALTIRIRVLQQDNAQMREALVEHGAFDEQTNLRTTVAFLEDAGVFVETNRRFDIPVTAVVVRIRYYNDLKSMLSEVRMRELVHVASLAIDHATRDNDITYLIGKEPPTWAVLLYSDEAGAQIAANRVRDAFGRELAQSDELKDVDLSFVIGVKQWDADNLAGPTELMAGAIKELEYDV